MTRKKKKSAGSGSRGAREQLPPELFPALRDIFEWTRNQGIPAALVGGAAVCLHGAVRATDDIDLLVFTTKHPAEILQSLVAQGYVPRHSDPVEFAQAARVLLMTHVSSGVAVDVMLGMLPFDQACIELSIAKRAGFGTVRIAPPEALCVMKLIAGRPHDLRDVAQLVETFPELDKDWVFEQLTQYATLMESPETLERARTALR